MQNESAIRLLEQPAPLLHGGAGEAEKVVIANDVERSG